MVGHQAVPQHPHAGGLTAGPQQREVGPPIIGGEEDVLAAVAALRDVVGDVRDSDTRAASQGASLPRGARMSSNWWLSLVMPALIPAGLPPTLPLALQRGAPPCAS